MKHLFDALPDRTPGRLARQCGGAGSTCSRRCPRRRLVMVKGSNGQPHERHRRGAQRPLFRRIRRPNQDFRMLYLARKFYAHFQPAESCSATSRSAPAARRPPRCSSSSCSGQYDHRPLRLQQGKGQPIRADGPQSHLSKDRHADHGRADDPVRHDGFDLAVGQSRATPMSGSCCGHARLRPRRLLRRLSEGHEADAQRLFRPHAARASKALIAASSPVSRWCEVGAVPFRPRWYFRSSRNCVVDLGWFFVLFAPSSSSAPAMR